MSTRKRAVAGSVLVAIAATAAVPALGGAQSSGARVRGCGAVGVPRLDRWGAGGRGASATDAGRGLGPRAACEVPNPPVIHVGRRGSGRSAATAMRRDLQGFAESVGGGVGSLKI